MEKYDKTYSSICRLCFKPSRMESMLSLQETLGKKIAVSYGKIVMKLAKISIDYDDDLPTKLCLKCQQMLQKIHAFKLMCQTSNRRLQKIKSLAIDSGENYKQRTCEYAMYHLYFPEEERIQRRGMGATKSKRNPAKMESENVTKPVLKLESKQEALTDNESDHDSDNAPLNTFTNNNIDSFLNKIESVVNIRMKSRNLLRRKDSDKVDRLLNSLENAVNLKTKYILRNKSKQKPKIKRTFQCNVCNKTLATRYNYNYHMQSHTKYEYICDQCGRGFPGRAPLMSHLVLAHGRGPALHCDHCQFKCYRRIELKEHIRTHTGERPFACEKCGLTFRRRAIWKNHLVQHGEKNVECHICQRKFYRQSDMTAHVNSVHERLFLYVCSMCNMSYAKSTSVRKHMLTKHGIPRNEQGKIKRVTRESNSLLFGENKGESVLPCS